MPVSSTFSGSDATGTGTSATLCNSVAPGHTPYVRNSAELSDFYRWWDLILAHLAKRGVAPAGLDEVVQAAWAARRIG